MTLAAFLSNLAVKTWACCCFQKSVTVHLSIWQQIFRIQKRSVTVKSAAANLGDVVENVAEAAGEVWYGIRLGMGTFGCGGCSVGECRGLTQRTSLTLNLWRHVLDQLTHGRVDAFTELWRRVGTLKVFDAQLTRVVVVRQTSCRQPAVSHMRDVFVGPR